MNPLRSFATFAFLVALFFGGGAHAANLITNGSFEVDNFNVGGGGYRLGLNGNDVTGWYIPASDGTYPWGLQNVNAYNAGPAAAGNQWLVLGEAGTGVEYTIQQTLTGLSSGSTYNVGFAIASEWGCCSTAEVSFLAGSATAAQTFSAPNSGQYWTQWSYKSMTFVANAASVTIQFKNLKPTADGYDLGLDDVSVSAVPEPSTWAMAGLGLAALWFVRRRREAQN
jgi:MYXO-CTERM domain-containing protein